MITENTNETVTGEDSLKNTNKAGPAKDDGMLMQESASKTLMKEVSEKVEMSSKSVKDKVVEMLAEKEVQARTDATMSVLSKLNETNKALNKVKPDNVSYDQDGKEVSATYSKAKFDERKKLLETRDSLDKALTLALVKNDFSKVKELANK